MKHRSVVCLSVVMSIVTSLSSVASDGEPPLAFADAVRLALAEQPRLSRLSAMAQSSRHAAVAAAQLPDPMLIGGIRDVPVTGGDAWSLRRDTDTQIIMGVEQQFTRAGKRSARSAVLSRGAEHLDAQRHLEQLTIARDAGLDWLALWRDSEAVALTEEALAESTRKVASGELALANGTARQIDLLRAQLQLEQIRDALAARNQSLESSATRLERWIGAAAHGRPQDPPDMTSIASESRLTDALSQHPRLAVYAAAIRQADAGAAVARAAYAPDWRLEVGYGSRPEYSDMVMVQVAMDLPMFTRNRQDKDLASALSDRDAAAAALEDERRVLLAEALLARRDLARLQARIEHYRTRVIPVVAATVEAALAAWGNGSGTLAEILDARLSLLEARTTALDLETDAMARVVELRYYAGDVPAGEDAA